MKPFTKIVTIAGVSMLILTLYAASVKGWGLYNLRSADQVLRDRDGVNCPDYRKDRFGNCPPRSHRTRLGARSFYGGGGK